MRPRFYAVLLAVGLFATVPLNASASTNPDLLQAKGMAADTFNQPPDFVDETAMPVIGDDAAGTSSAQTSRAARRSVQVNDPNLDHIQFFPNAVPQPQRPFEFSVQSETSVASFGENLVAGFNNSADQPVVQRANGTLVFAHRFLSGLGVSHDSGRTWTESSLPPPTGSPFTFGDPSVTVDRQGNFFYASLGASAAGSFWIFVGKSTNQGDTFAPGVVAAVDPGADKEWIAAGPDPTNPARDNLYVTWTSFQSASSELHLARSGDGGQTWTTSTLFAPTANAVTSQFIQFSNPVVDRSTGRLFVPFLHFGQADADFIKVLASDDGGLTFHFLSFNTPGSPDPTGFPNVTPGTGNDCGVNGGIRLVLHTGPDLGGGRRGFPRFRQATRLVTQPSAAAVDGKLFLAFNSSTSPVLGDPASRSQIRLLVSPDGGASFSGPFVVAKATSADPQHVHPAIVAGASGRQVTIGYYVQQSDGTLRVDARSGQIEADSERAKFEQGQLTRLSPSFNLTPSNNPLPAFGPNFTTNYDRTIVPCYNIGEYMSGAKVGARPVFVWGDDRNSWTSPPTSPAAGTHSQPDVFSGRARVDQ